MENDILIWADLEFIDIHFHLIVSFPDDFTDADDTLTQKKWKFSDVSRLCLIPYAKSTQNGLIFFLNLIQSRFLLNNVFVNINAAVNFFQTVVCWINLAL